MKLALVEPYIVRESLRAYADKPEPSHLLGMYNALADAGVDVDVIDAYCERLSPAVLVGRLLGGGYTHVGFTTYDYAPCLDYVAQVADGLRGHVTIVAGGPGATYTPERLAGLVRPDWIVRGDGEHALSRLVEEGFSTRAATRVGPCAVVNGEPVDLDEPAFARPYSLGPYAYEASVRVQRGCRGKCVFCLGAYQKDFSYLSRAGAEALFAYLHSDKSAVVISPCGPDFTAVPRKANEIVRALLTQALPLKAFRPGVRLDTLRAAILADAALWRALSQATDVTFESSIESFAPARLKRLGKNVGRDWTLRVDADIAAILADCPSKIVLGRIALDPTLMLEEFIADCEGYRRLLAAFPDQVTIGGMVMNEFVALWGTPAMAAGERGNIWAQRGCYADPRVGELVETLLDHPRFQLWCGLAENVPRFRERNEIFEEILREACAHAEQLRATAHSAALGSAAE